MNRIVALIQWGINIQNNSPDSERKKYTECPKLIWGDL